MDVSSRRDTTLLVICHANLVRSPLAAGLLRRHLAAHHRPDLRVESAGLVVEPGAAVSAEASDVARDLGVDLTRHHPSELVVQALSGSGLVMTMTEAQRSTVERLSPTAVARTFTALELVRLLPARQDGLVTWADLAAEAHARRPRVPPAATAEDVPDPVGRDLRFHRLVALQLAEICDHLAAVPARPVAST